jgi:hypothetical protein
MALLERDDTSAQSCSYRGRWQLPARGEVRSQTAYLRCVSRHHPVTCAALVLSHCLSVLMLVCERHTQYCYARIHDILKKLYAILLQDYTASFMLRSRLSA